MDSISLRNIRPKWGKPRVWFFFDSTLTQSYWLGSQERRDALSQMEPFLVDSPMIKK